MLNIVVVEAHDQLRGEWVDFLQRPGWQVHGVADDAALEAALLGDAIDIVVLDLCPPCEAGVGTARRLRAERPAVGLLALADRLADGYDTGADLCLPKPVDTHVLEAAIQVLGRRRQSRAPVLWPDRLQFTTASDDVLALAPVEALVLRCLALAPDTPITPDALIHRLCREHAVQTRPDRLDALIHGLTDRLDAQPAHHGLLLTVPGQGYRLGRPIRVA